MLLELPIIICGFPSPAEDYREDTLDFNTFLGSNRPSVYALRASGESMIGAGILPGDVVLVDKAKRPHNGSIVVACIDGEFTLKRLVLDTANDIILHAENPRYNDIRFHGLQEVEIFGTVIGIARRL